MTTRELCERLLKIHDVLKDAQPPRADVLYEVDELLLDLAAAEEEHLDGFGPANEPETEEKHPGVLVSAEKGCHYPALCLKCGSEVQKVAENRYYCPKCDKVIGKKPKREEADE